MRIEFSKRQKYIVELLREEELLAASSILEKIITEGFDISRPTLNRDLDELQQLGLISSHGQGPGTKYSITYKAKLETEVDVLKYFEKEPDSRNAYKGFNWQIFDQIDEYQIFNDNELDFLAELSARYQRNTKRLSETIIKKEIERVTIEFSWKSSKIEGNTYTLLEIENLIKNGIKASGHSKQEATMILNHKHALDLVYSNLTDFVEINKQKIEHIHSVLIKELNIPSGIRSLPVAITGTVYRPLDNHSQLVEGLEKSISLINAQSSVYAKSMLAMLFLSYLQLFEDGNKRTSRLIGNAILLAHNLCPLSLRSVDEGKYKQGLILFYEQNNLSLFKQIYLEQAEFAVENYFVS